MKQLDLPDAVRSPLKHHRGLGENRVTPFPLTRLDYELRGESSSSGTRASATAPWHTLLSGLRDRVGPM